MSDDIAAVILRDKSSGRYHRGVVIGDSLATPEGCNLDQSGAKEVLEQLPPIDDLALLCVRCFPAAGPSNEDVGE
jgi:hypothetical protein